MQIVMQLNYIHSTHLVGIPVMASNSLIQTRIDPDVKDPCHSCVEQLGADRFGCRAYLAHPRGE
ncbi:hypothetical protein D3C84_464730 [compost metagenome]